MRYENIFSTKHMTSGQRTKFRRNLVIYVASKTFSQRWLADVFDLPHSRIAAILKEMRNLEEHFDKAE